MGGVTCEFGLPSLRTDAHHVGVERVVHERRRGRPEAAEPHGLVAVLRVHRDALEGAAARRLHLRRGAVRDHHRDEHLDRAGVGGDHLALGRRHERAQQHRRHRLHLGVALVGAHDEHRRLDRPGLRRDDLVVRERAHRLEHLQPSLDDPDVRGVERHPAQSHLDRRRLGDLRLGRVVVREPREARQRGNLHPADGAVRRESLHSRLHGAEGDRALLAVVALVVRCEGKRRRRRKAQLQESRWSSGTGAEEGNNTEKRVFFPSEAVAHI